MTRLLKQRDLRTQRVLDLQQASGPVSGSIGRGATANAALADLGGDHAYSGLLGTVTSYVSRASVARVGGVG